MIKRSSGPIIKAVSLFEVKLPDDFSWTFNLETFFIFEDRLEVYSANREGTLLTIFNSKFFIDLTSITGIV